MISDQRTEGRWDEEEKMDGSRGWTFDVGVEEFVCGKRVEKAARTENLEARGLAQISVPKDTGGGLVAEAAI